MTPLDRFLTRNGISTEDFSATLVRLGYRASASWVRQIRHGHGEPSKKLAKGMVQASGGKLTMRQLLDLSIPAAEIEDAAVASIVPVVDAEVIAVEDRQPLDALKAVAGVVAIGFVLGLLG